MATGLYDKVLKVGGVAGLIAVLMVLGMFYLANSLLDFVTVAVNAKMDTMIEEQRHSNMIHGQMLQAIKELQTSPRYTFQVKP